MAEQAKVNGESRREMDELAAREAELRRREFDAFVVKGGVDDAEIARFKVQAALIADAVADAVCERIADLLDTEEGNTKRRVPAVARGGSREADSQRTRLRL